MNAKQIDETVIVFPNCKINLGLHILQKRADGFHDLQTVFYPVLLQDALELVQNAEASEKEIRFSSSGLSLEISDEENICIKAYRILKKDFPRLPSLKIHLHKTIPAGAGLGGGSADGAFMLAALSKKFGLALDKEQLKQYALVLGSDCPFFIENRSCFASGRGEILEPLSLDLSAYQLILVNPGIHVPTGWAFSRIRPQNRKNALKEIISRPVEEWKQQLENDFEEPVFQQYPEIGKIKTGLYEQGALYASMSGSGSTVYGLFEKKALPSFSFPPHYFVKSI